MSTPIQILALCFALVGSLIIAVTLAGIILKVVYVMMCWGLPTPQSERGQGNREVYCADSHFSAIHLVLWMSRSGQGTTSSHHSFQVGRVSEQCYPRKLYLQVLEHFSVTTIRHAGLGQTKTANRLLQRTLDQIP